MTPDAGTPTGGVLADAGAGTVGAGGSAGVPAAAGGTTSARGGATGTVGAPDAGVGVRGPAGAAGCTCTLGGRSSSRPNPMSLWPLFGLAALIGNARRRKRTPR